MYAPTLLRLLVFYSFTQLCLALPVNQPSNIENELPSIRQRGDEAESTLHSQQTTTTSSFGNEKRDPLPASIEKEYPLTHAMLKAIHDALPVSDRGVQKRDNSSGSGIPSASSAFNSLSPETQSMLKDTVRYGIALVMKQGAWALSP